MPRRALLLTVLFALVAVVAPGQDGALAVADVFDPSLARRPNPGDWLEYLVAFRVDPLENSLSAEPVPPPAPAAPLEVEGAFEGEGMVFFKPEFDPPAAWRVVPLRLEMREMDDAGINVVITFEGVTRETRIPVARPEAAAEFHYEDPQPETRRETMRVGDRDYEAEVVRRAAEGYGFVRYFSPDIPFGVIRFATEDVDLVLVGMGSGRPPEFPLRPAGEVLPPLGTAYTGRNGR